MNRPTFHAAVAGQSTEEEVKEQDLKASLEKREAEQIGLIEKASKQDPSNVRSREALDKPKLLKFEPEIDLEDVARKYDDADATVGRDSDDDFGSSDESESDEDDDDDDEEELQRELERIKAERAAALAKKEQEEKELEKRINTENALKSNPLVDFDGSNQSSKVKRRWNDDVIFRNQAKDEVVTKKRFINDTIRNDFHRSFLKKYVR